MPLTQEQIDQLFPVGRPTRSSSLSSVFGTSGSYRPPSQYTMFERPETGSGTGEGALLRLMLRGTNRTVNFRESAITNQPRPFITTGSTESGNLAVARVTGGDNGGVRLAEHMRDVLVPFYLDNVPEFSGAGQAARQRLDRGNLIVDFVMRDESYLRERSNDPNAREHTGATRYIVSGRGSSKIVRVEVEINRKQLSDLGRFRGTIAHELVHVVDRIVLGPRSAADQSLPYERRPHEILAYAWQLRGANHYGAAVAQTSVFERESELEREQFALRLRNLSIAARIDDLYERTGRPEEPGEQKALRREIRSIERRLEFLQNFIDEANLTQDPSDEEEEGTDL